MALNCTTYPGQPFIPFQPSYVLETTDLGWNAGAESLIELDGNIQTTFTMPRRNIGCFLGFAPAGGNVLDYRRITHGFYFSFTDNAYRVRVAESGIGKTAPVAYTTATAFRIERITGQVAYKLNGSVVFRSSRASSGSVLVATVLYASGDVAPGDE